MTTKRLNLYRGITLLGWASLGLLLLVWNTWLIDLHHHTLLGSLAIALVPLLLPLRGILQGEWRAYLAAALLSLMYFMHGVTEAFQPGDNLPASLEIAFSLIGFAGALGYAHAARSMRLDG